MDIVTLELFDLTVSQAVLEVQRVLDANPGGAVRILLDDETHKRNVIKLLEKHSRSFNMQAQGPVVTIDAKATKGSKRSIPLKPAPPVAVIQAEPKQPAIPPVLVLNDSLPAGDPVTGRRLLLAILRRADKTVPWIGIACEGASMLRDAAGLKALQEIQASGTPIRVSRECLLFHPEEASEFEVMEDSEWQGLLIKGKATRF